jgi:hypothetical protein
LTSICDTSRSFASRCNGWPALPLVIAGRAIDEDPEDVVLFADGRMEWPFSRPHQMRRVCLLELRFACPRESESMLRSLAPAQVSGPGWLQVQVVRMESQHAQQPGETREVAADDTLQIRHTAAAPVFEVLWREEAHADQNLDRSDHFALLQERIACAADPRIKRIVAVVVDADRRRPPGMAGPRRPSSQMRRVSNAKHAAAIVIAPGEVTPVKER